MKKTLWAFLLLWISSAVKGLQANQGGHVELTRLKMSLMYVRAIKTFRLLFMSLLGVGICMVLLFTGLILFHVSLFLYTTWSMETKLLVGFLSSAVYLLATLIIFSQVFAPEKWLEIFHAHGLIEHLKEEAVARQGKSESTNH